MCGWASSRPSPSSGRRIGCVASHQAAAAAHAVPRRRPPRTSVGQCARSTMRAQPTSSIVARRRPAAAGARRAAGARGSRSRWGSPRRRPPPSCGRSGSPARTRSAGDGRRGTWRCARARPRREDGGPEPPPAPRRSREREDREAGGQEDEPRARGIDPERQRVQRRVLLGAKPVADAEIAGENAHEEGGEPHPDEGAEGDQAGDAPGRAVAAGMSRDRSDIGRCHQLLMCTRPPLGGHGGEAADDGLRERRAASGAAEKKSPGSWTSTSMTRKPPAVSTPSTRA